MTGRKIIAVYQILIVASLAIELFLLSTCLRAAGEYAEVYPVLQRGKENSLFCASVAHRAVSKSCAWFGLMKYTGDAYPEYVSLEDAIQVKFNAIYFSSRTTCEGTSTVRDMMVVLSTSIPGPLCTVLYIFVYCMHMLTCRLSVHPCFRMCLDCTIVTHSSAVMHAVLYVHHNIHVSHCVN